MPRSSSEIVQLDPELMPLWRDGETLQFGVHGDVRIDASEPWVERVIARLGAGIPAATFDAVAHGLGAPIAQARRLLDVLRPVLRTPQPTPTVRIDNVNIADSRVSGWAREALEECGVPTALDTAAVSLVLIHGAVAATHLRSWLSDDAVHLPVSFDAGGAVVGPLVIPGRTPCLSCRDGHEIGRDDAWPLLHAQRIGRTDSPISRVLVSEVARVVDRLLCEDEPGGRIGSVSAAGELVWSAVRFHAECRCREPSFRSPRESAKEPAFPAPLPATRTA